MSSVTPKAPKSRANPRREKKCANCDNAFQTGSARTLYCSRKCAGKANEAKRQAIRRASAGLDTPYECRECGTSFMRDTRQRVYCADECKDKYNGRRRVRARRVESGLALTAQCSICGVEHEPRTKTQATCGSRACVNADTVKRRMKPCRECGAIGQYSTRTKDAGYCRQCRPVQRRAPMAIATMNSDYSEILKLLKSRSITTIDGCWEWQGPKTTGGYGCTSGAERIDDGATKVKMFMTHRLSLECKLGRPLGVHQAHHKCANRACCNPEHLQPVTSAENLGEMRARKSYEARIAELEDALTQLDPSHPLIRNAA